MIIEMIDESVRAGASKAKACELLGLAPTTLLRWKRSASGVDERRGPRGVVPSRLSATERRKIVETACSPEFRDLSPTQMVPILADRGEYIGSESTIYRVLREEGLLKHRGKAKAPARRHRPAPKVTTGPCQVWTWDITYLKSPIRGQFFYAYIAVDVWSRKIVAAEVHPIECNEIAARFIAAAVQTEGVSPKSLILHADNGGPMKGATILATLQALGVQSSFSRPRVSDDNPYSESLFRTLKYRPNFPSKPFSDLAAARSWVSAFVDWYNEVHLHSGIRFVTPSTRHAGRDREILDARRRTYEWARAAHPERWSKGIRNLKPVGDVTLHRELQANEGPATTAA